MTKTQKYPQTLLVEGKTDMHVVLALCEHYKVPQNFDVRDCDGTSNLMEILKLTLTNPSYLKTIGIILDADNDLTARLDQIRNILNPHGYKIPKALSAKGLVCTSSDVIYPKLGLWLMPDNVNLGMIEDFALSMTPNDDLLMAEAEAELQRIEQSGINQYQRAHHSKAKIHTYLAWQNNPGNPIGTSITKRVLNPDYPMAENFVKNWLIPLFSADLI